MPSVPGPLGAPGPSRRALLGAAGALGAGGALLAPGSASAVPAVPAARGAAEPVAAAGAALRRLLPHHAGQFTLRTVEPAGSGDHFRVSGSTGRIIVEGTTAGTLLTGVHWYLKYVCGAQIAWQGSRLELPSRLPAPTRPLSRTTKLPHRFALNDTNDGYTAPYADWPYWERMIDILALHGCNEVMVVAGTEAVYHRLLKDSGYSDTEARAWLPAPSHQPWWLLQNLYGYGGPLSAQLVAKRAQLGRRIADRLRELGMAPVLPGYYGHVPKDFAERAGGDAHVVPQGTWHGFDRPAWLDPRTESFARTAAAFYRHQQDVFGPAAHFKMDLLHEGGTAGDVPVPDAAAGVQRALDSAHPGATWVILGWEANPLPALLDAVDKRRMLIVDGVSDRYTSVTDRERDWGGTPYCFGTIPNFGGRTTIGARTHLWNEKFFAWRDKAGSALAGTAFLPEGTDRDPACFELFSELAWLDTAPERSDWFAGYADFRYGPDPEARAAWRTLADTAYRHTAVERSDPHDSLFAARPDLSATRASVYAPSALTYDPARFDAVLAHLLAVAPQHRRSPAYGYDLVDVARQALAHRSRQYLPLLKSAHQRGDRAAFGTLAALWLKLMRLSDDIAGTHPGFLLGPWVRDARALATTDAERTAFEQTAKALITVWGGRSTADGGKLHDYGNREWHGVVGEFYLPRWQRWLDEVADAMAEGREPKPVDWFAMEEPWTTWRRDYPLRPVGDPHRTAAKVRDTLAAAPYQGAVTVRAEPAAFPPGGRATVSAEFRNTNGLAPTGAVDFALEGPDAEPDGGTTLPSVPPAGRGTVRWRATAPSAPLDRPLRPLPYTITVRYGPKGQERVADVQRGTLFEAGPLAAGWHTVSTNDAVFGQLGERFAVNGGGADLWKGTAEFGCAYRGGVLTDGTSLLLTVDSQQNTGSWARAGIAVRNRLADAASGGFLDLAVTPGNGVVLSWDSDGDGTLDTYRGLAGVKAPVLLRLRRHGTDFTGDCSTDGGASWRTVATVAVPHAAAAQDAGLFMSATNAGGTRGTVEFSGWHVE
ncbi:alpha-N-acetylglucosaminidase [Streptomyces sp. NPDC058045]|uniref:alpha-N-acetylglucosaminidase n=1 Tax=Streptomyces sp. NPDC058045 TaxID=3346311 RepID=UPI0036E5C966